MDKKPDALQAIRESAIDGRAQNPFFRQTQLQRLHAALAANESKLQEAIVRDTGNAEHEAQIEFALALLAVKHRYDELDPEKELEEEYSVAKGKNYEQRRDAVGIVCIAPTQYTLLYSVVVPLSSAIAAGNCVVVELEPTISELSKLLSSVLTTALDKHTFVIANSRAETETLRHQTNCIEVLQTPTSQSSTPTLKQLLSPSTFLSIAIVDRTADLSAAAKALVAARFGFGGKSPYAPDVVLVNEFTEKAFLDAVLRESVAYLTARRGGEKRFVKPAVKTLIEEVGKDDGARIVTSGENGAVVAVEKRSSPFLHRKTTTPTLFVHTVRSLDDAIDLANTLSTTNATETSTSNSTPQTNNISSTSTNTPTPPLLSTLIFATPKAAKYLSQFTPSHRHYINHIPTPLLLGPAYPLTLTHAPPSSSRYPTHLFTLPQPTYTPPPSSSSADEKKQQLSKLSADAKSLTLKKRRESKPLGFFEQGIFIGLGIFGVPLLAGVVAVGWFGGRAVWGRWR